MEKIYIIAGPTASGKTATSIAVAQEINGEIICADSMQIYKGMDIGTAKVTLQEMQGIPHYMYEIVDPNEKFTVSDYVALAREKIADIISRGKSPIIVGGTGLYIESLIYDYSLGNAVSNDKVKRKLLDELDKHGAEYLHNRLREIDPADAEKIHPNNTKRLIRALEIYELTGNTKSQTAVIDRLPIYNVDMNVLDFPRDELYERINKRVEIMFDNGLINEIRHLIGKGYTFDLQSMQAIGYKEFAPYIQELDNTDTMLKIYELIAKNSRNYAKRQITWFKRYDFADWLSPSDCIEKYK